MTVVRIPARRAPAPTAEWSPMMSKEDRAKVRWTGLKIGQCQTCGHLFSTQGNFEKHRSNQNAAGDRHCLDPRTVGLVPRTSVVDDAGTRVPNPSLTGHIIWVSPGRENEAVSDDDE